MYRSEQLLFFKGGVSMKLKKTRFDILLNVLCLLQLIGITLFLLICWARIPQQIPMHYDLGGNIKFLITCLYTYSILQTALMLELPSWVLFAVIALLCGDIGYWMYRLWKCK